MFIKLLLDLRSILYKDLILFINRDISFLYSFPFPFISYPIFLGTFKK